MIDGYIIEYREKRILYNVLKRIIDVVLSLIALVLLSPLLVLIVCFIKIDSKGPAIFSQDRVGKNRKVFRMHKFRSMYINAEEEKERLLSLNEMSGPMFKIKSDPRITRVGRIIRKTSIDELPQLWNVLKGDMSLVGPRPSLPEEVEQFEEWMLKRLYVKPGLTCYWQVMGRNSLPFEEWMRLDVKYVQDRNLLVDFKLIFKTIFVLFGDENAS